MEHASIEFNKINSGIQIVEDVVIENDLYILVEVEDMGKENSPCDYISSNFYDWFGDGIYSQYGEKKLNKDGDFDEDGNRFILTNSWY